MKYPSSIQALINQFAKLPTVGPKTAERYVFYLLQQSPEYLQKFGQTIAELKDKITICRSCFAVSESSICHICADEKRNKEMLCIVSNTRDMLSLENSHEYNGQYHVLGGLISAVEGKGPENLTIKQLEDKIKKNSYTEILIALNPTLDGETTSMYLQKFIRDLAPQIKISRLAKGLPMGADLEYADELTLANAIKYRNAL